MVLAVFWGLIASNGILTDLMKVSSFFISYYKSIQALETWIEFVILLLTSLAYQLLSLSVCF